VNVQRLPYPPGTEESISEVDQLPIDHARVNRNVLTQMLEDVALDSAAPVNYRTHLPIHYVPGTVYLARQKGVSLITLSEAIRRLRAG
jgi:hypothetical protein